MAVRLLRLCCLVSKRLRERDCRFSHLYKYKVSRRDTHESPLCEVQKVAFERMKVDSSTFFQHQSEWLIEVWSLVNLLMMEAEYLIDILRHSEKMQKRRMSWWEH